MGNLFTMLTVRADYGQNALVILDQTCLPNREVYLALKTAEEIWEAIYSLKVRGAPAIGVAAAYGVAVLMQGVEVTDFESFYREFVKVKKYLESSRPTAVNLFMALDRMEAQLLRHREGGVKDWKRVLREEAEAVREEDAVACKRIGEWGLSLLRPGMGLLTHCNAGHLAVSEYGTALAPIYLGQERGYAFSVFADETRPLLQGARLTAYELQKAGVDVTLICDNMASTVMKQGRVQAVLVGCDRVAANGDTANKIGTSGVAVLAKYYDIPFYVLGPTSTIDMGCPTGEQIEIEERAREEVTEKWYARRMAPEGVKVYNPAFDVTSADLITAIITERGIAYPPFGETLRMWKEKTF
ncbi:MULTISPECIES: S-methyl-5-thioribose-1-phosphate isomerase [Butyricimonas]|uniref:S-methyl-5-thioribose-1-phosphate isomerase n=1 Tax=Butyricimonas TaxID=574697 RepID=UPI001D0757F5|nr:MULTISPECIES: S-methyl-5-thioribose-1-phosphate isomerase [Butyricimonas]MCB6973545.1 S-methyl-5-thioribose-1-phosphate isomerase [Butyricimonas synergistica]MCG4520352.1 S-methyl-5-thioribose-1-phosphate isomerase [Butyricimonas sp. DFI.6.44]